MNAIHNTLLAERSYMSLQWMYAPYAIVGRSCVGIYERVLCSVSSPTTETLDRLKWSKLHYEDLIQTVVCRYLFSAYLVEHFVNLPNGLADPRNVCLGVCLASAVKNRQEGMSFAEIMRHLRESNDEAVKAQLLYLKLIEGKESVENSAILAAAAYGLELTKINVLEEILFRKGTYLLEPSLEDGAHALLVSFEGERVEIVDPNIGLFVCKKGAFSEMWERLLWSYSKLICSKVAIRRLYEMS